MAVILTEQQSREVSRTIRALNDVYDIDRADSIELLNLSVVVRDEYMNYLGTIDFSEDANAFVFTGEPE